MKIITHGLLGMTNTNQDSVLLLLCDFHVSVMETDFQF